MISQIIYNFINRVVVLCSFHSSACLTDIQTCKAPIFPESIAEGDMTWKKAVGDSVHMDEIIGEVETDKTALPVMSPVSGILTELLVEEGGKVTPYQEIFKIDEKPVEEVKETAPKSDPVAPPQPTSPPPPPVSLCLSV